MTYSPKVGDVVVIIDQRGHPCTHNSGQIAELGGNGCRGKVLKVCRKIYYVSSKGTPWPVYITPGDHSWLALPVEQAREMYRKVFDGDARGQEFIDRCINNL